MIFLSFPRVECPIFFFSSSVTAEPTNRPLELVGGRRKFPVDLVYKGNCLSSILSTVKIDLLGPSAKTIDVYTVDILVFRQTIKRRRDETKGSTAGQTVSFSPPGGQKAGHLGAIIQLTYQVEEKRCASPCCVIGILHTSRPAF